MNQSEEKWENLIFKPFKAIGGGPGSKKQVKLIWKCLSIRSQRFLPFVNILPGARDMFCRSLGISAEMRDIPIPSYLKNHAQNEHKMIIF